MKWNKLSKINATTKIIVNSKFNFIGSTVIAEIELNSMLQVLGILIMQIVSNGIIGREMTDVVSQLSLPILYVLLTRFIILSTVKSYHLEKISLYTS